jgi:hypothetical protein
VHKIEDLTEQIVTGAGYSPVPARISHLVTDSPMTQTLRMGAIEDHIVKLFNMTGVHLRSSYAFLTFILDHTGGKTYFNEVNNN